VKKVNKENTGDKALAETLAETATETASVMASVMATVAVAVAEMITGIMGTAAKTGRTAAD
jgi:hypothetical protein